MNHTHIKWPNGVTTDAPVLAEHDVNMAMRSFDLLVFKQKQLKLHKAGTQPAHTSKGVSAGLIMRNCGPRQRCSRRQTQRLLPCRALPCPTLLSCI